MNWSNPQYIWCYTVGGCLPLYHHNWVGVLWISGRPVASCLGSSMQIVLLLASIYCSFWSSMMHCFCHGGDLLENVIFISLSALFLWNCTWENVTQWQAKFCACDSSGFATNPIHISRIYLEGLPSLGPSLTGFIDEDGYAATDSAPAALIVIGRINASRAVN